MIDTLATGWQLLKRHKKAVVFYYLSNLLIASLLLLPFMTAFEQSLGKGDYRAQMLEKLDYDWFELFKERAPAVAATFSPTVTSWGPFLRNLHTLLTGRWGALPWESLGLGLVYLLANCYLTGAAVASVTLDPRGNSIREFLRLGGEFFGRFFRLSLLSLASFGLVYVLILGPWHSWVKEIAAAATTDLTAGMWSIFGVLAGGVILAFVNLVFDYAKIITAAADRGSTLLASISALFFCINYLFSAAGLYSLLSLIGILWIAGMTLLEGLVPQSAGTGILAAFLIQQAYVVGRMVLRLYFYTSQTEFYLRREGLYRPGEEGAGLESGQL